MIRRGGRQPGPVGRRTPGDNAACQRAAGSDGGTRDIEGAWRPRQGSAVALASREVGNPEFPDAVVRTPVMIEFDGAGRWEGADDEAAYMDGVFGPVFLAVAVELGRGRGGAAAADRPGEGGDDRGAYTTTRASRRPCGRPVWRRCASCA